MIERKEKIKDTLIKALALGERVRVYIVRNTDTANEACVRHDLWPSATSVLGKTMAIGLIMGGMLKGDEALTIKIDGNGPIGTVVVDSNAKGEVRGYTERSHVNFTNKTGLDDVATLGYNGYIDVIKDLKLKDLFTSTIPLQTGDLAKDFTYYFTVSEQTPSVVALGSKVGEDNRAIICGGLAIQLLPNALEEDITYIESKLHLISKMSEVLIENTNLEDILKLLFDNDYRLLESNHVKFKCHCSKDHFAGGVATLSKKEIQEMIDKDGKAEVVCHYCGNHYYYSKEDLEKIIKGAK